MYLSHGLLILLVLGLGVGLWRQAGELAKTQKKRDVVQDELESTIGELESTKTERESVTNQLKSVESDRDLKQGDLQSRLDAAVGENGTLKQQKDESDRRAIAYNLSKIPTRWEGLVLSAGKGNNELFLPGSEFLHDRRDEVKVQYDPFVDLKSPKTYETISNLTLAVQYKDSKLPVIFKLSYTFVDSEGREQSRQAFEIAKIELTDGGLRFTWQDDGENRETEAWYYPEKEAWFQIKNRILLSKLTITVGSESRKIDLWTPSSTEGFIAADDDSIYHGTRTETSTKFSTQPFSTQPGKATEGWNLDKAATNTLISSSSEKQTQNQTRIYLLKPGTSATTADNSLLLLLQTK
jgi:hypothetical protein